MLTPDIHQNLFKNWSQEERHLKDDRFLELIFWWLHFGAKLGPCWNHFRLKCGKGMARRSLFVTFFFVFPLSWPHLGAIFPFGCQFDSVWAPKIYLNPSKNRSQEASKKWSISRSICLPSWLHFGSQVGSMLELFSTTIRVRHGKPLTFLLQNVFDVLSPSWRGLGPLQCLEPIWVPSPGLHFGKCLAPCWWSAGPF